MDDTNIANSSYGEREIDREREREREREMSRLGEEGVEREGSGAFAMLPS